MAMDAAVPPLLTVTVLAPAAISEATKTATFNAVPFAICAACLYVLPSVSEIVGAVPLPTPHTTTMEFPGVLLLVKAFARLATDPLLEFDAFWTMPERFTGSPLLFGETARTWYPSAVVGEVFAGLPETFCCAAAGRTTSARASQREHARR